MNSWFKNIREFFREVKEEWLKCTRPSVEELKESTLVIVITMAILGLFIFGSDLVISRVLGLVITN